MSYFRAVELAAKRGKKYKKRGDDPCWKGYKQIGMKIKDGHEVPNCVPMEEGEREPEAAAVFHASEYTWYTFVGKKSLRLRYKTTDFIISPTDKFGVREATSKAGAYRLVSAAYGSTKVISLTEQAYNNLLARSKRTKMPTSLGTATKSKTAPATKPKSKAVESLDAESFNEDRVLGKLYKDHFPKAALTLSLDQAAWLETVFKLRKVIDRTLSARKMPTKAVENLEAHLQTRFPTKSIGVNKLDPRALKVAMMLLRPAQRFVNMAKRDAYSYVGFADAAQAIRLAVGIATQDKKVIRREKSFDSGPRDAIPEAVHNWMHKFLNGNYDE